MLLFRAVLLLLSCSRAFRSVSDELLDEAADHFEAFFSEVFEELYKYGEVEDMVVCDNIGDHIIGNVYVKYSDDDAAKKALSALQGRYYAGKHFLVLRQFYESCSRALSLLARCSWGSARFYTY